MAFAFAMVTTAHAYHETLSVTLNGVRLGPDQIRMLERTYGFRAQSGRYWYHARTGLWGREGGPALGQLGSTYGGEQLYRSGSGQSWRNGDGWGYSNPNTGTSILCDGGGCLVK